MFELGLRLAFDKPTIIIKDEKTEYSFDISVIEHLPYPSSLHYWEIKKFETDIKDKIVGTLKKAKKDKTYSPFLKNFDRLVPAKLGEKQIPEMEYIQGMFNDIARSIASLSAKLESYEMRQRNDDFSPDVRAMPIMHGEKRGGVSRLRKRPSLLRQLEQERENLKNVNSAQAASEVTKKIEELENKLYYSHIADL